MPANRSLSVAAPVFPVHDIAPRNGQAGTPVIIVEPITADVAIGSPHRHAFTQLVLVERGTGTHQVDFASVPIRAGELHLLAPGQVHHWQADPGLRCLAILFSEDALDPLGLLPDRIRELLLLGAAPIAPSATALARMRRFFAAIKDAPSPETGAYILAALLHECADASAEHQTLGSHSVLTRDFMRCVLRSPDARLTVASCAARLNVTAGYLAEQVVADTGSTPGRILRTAIAREAQRLLSGSDLSAAQISSKLGFSEPSYFSRFFRREVGSTPTEYRGLGTDAVARPRKERHAS
ncbi:MAG: helix-turn-helix domain-containing protein [Leucobacter sp.]